MEVIIFLLVMVLLNIAILWKGHDSRDRIRDAEWERRWRWVKLHPTYHW